MSENVTQTVTPMRQQVAEEIRALLARRRISASELARRLGVNQPYISRRLTGETAADVDDLQRIAEVLGVAVVDLLPAADRPRLRTVEGVTTMPHRNNIYYSERTHRPTRRVRTAPDTKGRTGRPTSRPDDHPTPNDVTPKGRTGQVVRRAHRITAPLPDAA